MKRFLMLLLAGAMLGSTLHTATLALDMPTQSAVQLVQSLGILQGDERGNLQLSNTVSRAEFAKMMVSASVFKDSVGSYGKLALYQDVPSSHWANAYIKLAVEQGWFTGYSDGTFRPQNPIALEEALTALLRLLGYVPSDFSGAFPHAQVAKADSIGLCKNLSRPVGETLLRSDCALLFRNALNAKNKEGTVYATVLGHTLNQDGELDQWHLLQKDLKGSFVLEAGTTLASAVPFPLDTATLYRNDKETTAQSVSAHDVLYYNASVKKVWLYDERLTGTYTAFAPDAGKPTSVTVNGKSYALGSDRATEKFSQFGSVKVGDKVTLLFGMGHTVVEVLPASALSANGLTWGMVTEVGQENYSNAQGVSVGEFYTKVVSTEGLEQTYYIASNIPVGTVVSMQDSPDGVTLKRLSKQPLSGQVNQNASKLGERTLASDIHILEIGTAGRWKTLDPARLQGVTLSQKQVLYHAKNARGEVTDLILQDVTGDCETYAYIHSIEEETDESNLRGQYGFLVNGEAQSLSLSNGVMHVIGGGARVQYSKGTPSSLRNLTRLSGITNIQGQEMLVGNQVFSISEGVQCYRKENGKFLLTDLESLGDGSQYTLTAWYDDFGYPAGGQIRIILAVLN